MTPRLSALLVVALFGCDGRDDSSTQPTPPATPTSPTKPTQPTEPTPEPPARQVIDLTAELAPIVAGSGAPSVAAAVVDSEGLLASGVSGKQRSDDGAELEASARYHLGSCGKAMTATLVAILVQQGAMSWHSTLDAIFGDMTIHEAFRSLTIRELLGHRAGLARDEFDVPGVPEDLSTVGDAEAQRALLTSVFLTRAPASRVGAFAYSNVGYAIAAAAIETQLGQSYEALLQSKLFDAWSMGSCGFGPPAAADPKSPWGHSEGTPITPSVEAKQVPAGFNPAGGMHCGMADWARFATEHLRAARGKSRRLDVESARALHTPLDGEGERYALGWSVDTRDWASGPLLNHDGSDGTFLASVWIVPSKDRAYLAATNDGEAEDAIEDALSALIEE